MLYPGQQPFEMKMAEDADGMHFGAFTDGLLAGVVSLFHMGTDFQFRKLAVKPDQQHQGIGTALLDAVAGQAMQDGGMRLWCNARTTAIPFYLKKNFAQNGEVFEKNGIVYVRMEKSLIK